MAGPFFGYLSEQSLSNAVAPKGGTVVTLAALLMLHVFSPEISPMILGSVPEQRIFRTV